MSPEQRAANKSRTPNTYGKIVWIATYKGRKARIVSGKPVPAWIHEYGEHVQWKVIEGAEYLPAPTTEKEQPNAN